MFIGGLSWDTTDGNVDTYLSCYPAKLMNYLFILSPCSVEGLNEYFSQFGKIDASVILKDGEGRSRGFAFLTFEDPASVNKVLAQNHFLDGKSVCRFIYYSRASVFL